MEVFWWCVFHAIAACNSVNDLVWQFADVDVGAAIQSKFWLPLISLLLWFPWGLKIVIWQLGAASRHCRHLLFTELRRTG